MVKLGITTKDLAREISFNPSHVANVLAGTNKSWPVCSKINAFFGENIFSIPPRQMQRTHRKMSKLSTLRTPTPNAKKL
jgi:hypothetical protein